MIWSIFIEYNIIYYIIGGWFIFSACYIYWATKNPDRVNIDIYDSIPIVFTTLGVLGTFIGIYCGLQQFDVNDINSSIPSLLEGLKTAFLTSIVGISLSLVMGKIAQIVLHNAEKTTSQTNEIDALNKIANILQETKNEINKMHKSLAGDNTDSVAMQLVKINNKFTEMQTMQIEKLNDIVSSLGGDDETSLLSQIQKMRYEQNEFSATAQKNMEQNRDYIAKKFEEFIVLLAKSNTEELVSAMKAATEQFNEQMKELIDRLIKENFEELNSSVLRMNNWQQENKEMIGTLTQQFKEVSQDFTASAQSIKEITQNTEKLTNDNSILKRLVEELQKVMIDDKKFSEITDKLSDTADKTQEITENLQKWIKDEKYFSDSVKTLLDKLENVEKIKDINEIFWQNLKKQLEDGVGMIRAANERLANDIKELDNDFEVRLKTVFENLDRLIAQALQYRSDSQAKQ